MGRTLLKISDAWSYTAEADNLLRVAGALRDRGHRILLVTKPDTPLTQRALEAGLEVETVSGFRAGWNLPAAAWAPARLAGILRRVQPDLVHVYRSSVHTLALVARGLGSWSGPVIRTRANAEPPRSSWLSQLLYSRWTEATVVAAEHIREMLVRAGYEQERMVKIEGAVRPEIFEGLRNAGPGLREEFGIPRDAPVVGCVARLAPVKGHSVLLKAMVQVLESVPDTWLLLVGPAWPGMEEKVLEEAGRLGIRDRTVWTGPRTDVPALMSAMDVGVVASLGSEALSRVTLEYMASRLPVVATRVGGIPEMLPAEAGVLVEPGQPKPMARALVSLLQDPQRRRSLGEQGRLRVESSYTLERQVDRLEQLYSRILASRSAVTAPDQTVQENE
jgi:glycosyltransferase involved in cell wall biosynthesis